MFNLICGRGASDGVRQQQCGLGTGKSALIVLGLGCLWVKVLHLLSDLPRFLVVLILAHSEGGGVPVLGLDSVSLTKSCMRDFCGVFRGDSTGGLVEFR